MATDALIAQTLSPLINGVSQQPAQTRLASQAEAQENILSDVAEGILRRPPAEHIALLGGSAAGALPTGGFYTHMINRGDGQQFIVLIEDGDINVFNALTGAEVTVNDGAAGSPGSYTYLNITPSSTVNAGNAFEAVTIADYTFILNKQQVVAMSGSASAARSPAHEMMLFIKDATATSSVNRIKMKFGNSSATGVGAGTANDTEEMMDNLCTAIAGVNNPNDDAGTAGGSINDWKFTRLDNNTLHAYQFQNANDVVSYSDRYGDNLGLLLATGPAGEPPTAARFSDLPRTAADGFIVKIKGDDGTDEDEFYVKFVKDEQIWKETVAPGLDDSFSAVTMPHALVYDEGTGQFTFQPVTWDSRLVGDTVSAPEPSFIGQKIKDIALVGNRLVFVADENAIASETGEFFNFWPTTATTIVDSDPWDTAGTGARISTWEYALPFLGGVTLFSPVGSVLGEIIGSRDEPLTVKNARIEESGTWAHAFVKPASSGDALFFCLERGDHTAVFQYSEAGPGTFSANEINSHVPKYIPGGVRRLSAGLAENALILQTTEEVNALYVYRFHYLANDQVMSSWSRWTFGTSDTIVAAEWIDSILYALIHRQDGLHLEKLDFGKTDEDEGAGVTPLGYRVHLDSLVSVSGSYSPPPVDYTTWVLPYDQATNGGTYKIAKGGAWGATRGEAITVLSAGVDGFIQASGNFSSQPVYIGREYESSYEFSEPVIRETSATSKKAARLSGRIQVLHGRLVYKDTGSFDVEVRSKKDSDVYTDTFTGDDSPQEMADGVFSFYVGGDSKNARIILLSNSHLPFKVSSFEWDGRFVQRSTSI